MPAGKHRSRSFTRKRVRLPGKRNVLHYARRKPDHASCKSCGARLNGVPRKGMAKYKTLAKSQKRPSKPHGGELCTRCLGMLARDAIFTPSN